MTTTIPLTAVPAQTLSVTLGGQRCTITVSQRSTGLYADVAVAGTMVIAGMICRDRVPLKRSSYIGFVGNLAFIDTQGVQDPDYTGLGGRYKLVYLP